jgi:hypothetical protein
MCTTTQKIKMSEKAKTLWQNETEKKTYTFSVHGEHLISTTSALVHSRQTSSPVVPSDTPLLYIFFISSTGACDNYLRHR